MKVIDTGTTTMMRARRYKLFTKKYKALSKTEYTLRGTERECKVIRIMSSIIPRCVPNFRYNCRVVDIDK
jgi:hypothetical protein